MSDTFGRGKDDEQRQEQAGIRGEISARDGSVIGHVEEEGKSEKQEHPNQMTDRIAAGFMSSRASVSSTSASSESEASSASSSERKRQQAQQSFSEARLITGSPGSATGYFMQFASSLSQDKIKLDPYLPEFVKNYAVGGAKAWEDLRLREEVVFAKVESLKGNGFLLLLGYLDGFHVWHSRPDGAMLELTSIRNGIGPIQLIHLLKTPAEHDAETAESKRMDASRPLLAVVPRNSDALRLYSLKIQKLITKIRVGHNIVDVQSNLSFIAVGTVEGIVIYDAVFFEQQFHVSRGSCPFSLSERWIAFEGSELVLGTEADTQLPSVSTMAPRSTHGEDSQTLESSLSTTMKSAAKEVASGLYHLGDLGLQKLEGRRSGEFSASGQQSSVEGVSQTSSAQSAASKKQGQGSVVVQDLASREMIANFRSHRAALALLRFDPSGTLLATCSENGQTVHVHRILPRNPSDLMKGKTSCHSSASHSLMYILTRGMTKATIRSIEFSSDSRWVSASTARGTTHIFAINPDGGSVNTYSHKALSQAQGQASGGRSWRERFASVSSSFTSGSPPFSSASAISTSLGSVSSLGSGVEKHNNNAAQVLPAFPPTKFRNESQPLQTLVKVGPLARIRLQMRIIVKDEIEPCEQTKSSDKFMVPISAFHEGSSLFLVSALGILEEYRLCPVVSEPDSREIVLQAHLMKIWDACRRSNWNEVRKPCSASFNSTPNETSSNSKLPDWLSNVETKTHAAPLTQIWASPQFSFATFKQVGLYDDQIKTSPIVLKGEGPEPPMTEEVRSAIETPATFQDLYIPTDVEQHVLTFDDEEIAKDERIENERGEEDFEVDGFLFPNISASP